MSTAPVTLDDHISAVGRFIDVLWGALESVPSQQKDARVALVTAFQTLALEHVSAIVVLMKAGLAASAFALMRPMHEAYVRGRWLHHCAGEAQLLSAAAEEKFPKITPMLAALRAAAPEDGATAKRFSQFHESFWKRLNSFTHGGRSQLVDRITSSGVKGSASDAKQIAALKMTAAYGLLIVTDLALLFEDTGLAIAAREQLQVAGLEPSIEPA